MEALKIDKSKNLSPITVTFFPSSAVGFFFSLYFRKDIAKSKFMWTRGRKIPS